MFAKILKMNPYHDSTGKFTYAPHEHMYMRDMQKQYKWLQSKLKRLHVSSVDELVEKHPDQFTSLANAWRQKHPLN